MPPFVWWATTIAWTLTIYTLSTETFGVSLTGFLLAEALDLLHVEISPAAFEMIHFWLRKLAHLTEYAIYALLLYGSFGSGRDFGWRWRRAVLSAGIAAGFSLTDELHQWFVPGRAGTLADSALDAGGAILAMAGVYVVHRLVPTKERRTAAAAASPAET